MKKLWEMPLAEKYCTMLAQEILGMNLSEFSFLGILISNFEKKRNWISLKAIAKSFCLKLFKF